MEKYPVHNLASICQRMPLDVYVLSQTKFGDKTHAINIRVVKSQFVEELRELDGRIKIDAELNLNGIYVRF